MWGNHKEVKKEYLSKQSPSELKLGHMITWGKSETATFQ